MIDGAFSVSRASKASFRERLQEFPDAIVLIGGAACDEWFADQGLTFRATKDLDIVLIIEVIEPGLVAALRSFFDEGGYEIRERAKGTPVLYRFAKPANIAFPSMLEFFSRKPDGLELLEEQRAVPVTAGMVARPSRTQTPKPEFRCDEFSLPTVS